MTTVTSEHQPKIDLVFVQNALPNRAISELLHALVSKRVPGHNH